jgi:hypothetical protein
MGIAALALSRLETGEMLNPTLTPCINGRSPGTETGRGFVVLVIIGWFT